MLILDGLRAFGRMLGVTSADKSEALLHSEAGARSLLSRRGFIGASAALAAAAVTYSLSSRIWVGRPGHLYMSLHTAEPGAFGANEASYSGYAPAEVERTAEHWTVGNGFATNAQAIDFPMATGGDELATHLSICDHLGRPMMAGPLARPMAIRAGIQLRLMHGGIVVDGCDGSLSVNAGDPVPLPKSVRLLADGTGEVIYDEDWADAYERGFSDFSTT